MLLTLVGSSFNPALAPAADSIPSQVPEAVVVYGEDIDGRVLRGDFEIPDRVLLVYTESWPEATERIADQVLGSGARLALVLEVDNSRARMQRMIRRLGRVHGEGIEVHGAQVDTPWVRDWGPLQARRGAAPLWLDADYDDAERQADDGAPMWLAQQHGIELAELPWALDGGAFISNGAGLCVLTFEYLDEQGIVWDQDDLGGMLGQLGCRVTAVIPTLVDEETKHADMVGQFLAADRLVMAEIIDDLGGRSEDAMRLRSAELGIRKAAAALGFELDVSHVPTPANEDGQNPRSYVNGLRLGDRYLMPSYPELGDAWELPAWAAMQDAMGEVPVVPLDTSDMIAVGGAIHCASLGLFSR